jgi:hypothetical protein
MPAINNFTTKSNPTKKNPSTQPNKTAKESAAKTPNLLSNPTLPADPTAPTGQKRAATLITDEPSQTKKPKISAATDLFFKSLKKSRYVTLKDAHPCPTPQPDVPDTDDRLNLPSYTNNLLDLTGTTGTRLSLA